MSDDQQTEKVELYQEKQWRKKVWRAKDESPVMTSRERLLIGGVGALTPLIANLLVVDLETVLSNTNKFALIGYFIRVIILFIIGVVVSYLHDDETNRVKAFQFGMAAPAMLLATINGSQLSTNTKNYVEHTPAAAHAAPIETTEEDELSVDEPSPGVQETVHFEMDVRDRHESPDGSAGDQFMRGLILKQKH